MMRKKIVSLCMALALCLGLLPVTALAAGEIELYVGGQKITESGCYENQNGTWTKVDGTEPANGQFSYDAATATLTLNQAKIVNYQDVTVGGGFTYPGSVIAFSQSADVSLTIVVSQGTSNITGTGGIRVVSKAGDASLSISGPGSLEVNVDRNDSGISLIGSKNVNLNIDGADVKTLAAYYYGVDLHAGDGFKAAAVVNNGKLTAGGSGGIGIYYRWTNPSDSGTSSLTVSGNAVVDTRDSKILIASQASEVQVSAGSDGNGGIVFDGKSGTVYGDVTLEDDLEIASGETLTIPDDSSLNSNGKLTNNGKIIVDNGGKLEGEPTGSGTVKIAPTITTENLTNGEVGTLYTAKLEADGDTPITWGLASDSFLPAGLSLSADGTISGKPTTANTYTFTVTATNASGSDSKQFSLTIDPKQTVSVTGVTLDQAELSLYTGESKTLIATVQPSDATIQNVTWESSNTEVATVDANGKVTAEGEGEATITVTTADGGKTATCTVTVTRPYIPPANPNYRITVEATQGGAVTADPTAAKAGTTVTLTPVPHRGYQVGSVAVTDRFGEPVAVTEQADGTYTFTMPNGQVTVTVTFEQAPLPFPDVTEGDWFYDAVRCAYENSLMDGVGDNLFAPNSETTRAQLVTILYRLAGEPEPGGDSGFADVAAGTWYTDAVAWAAENGIVNGVSDTEFAPGDDITREQLAAILYRYAAYQGYDVSQRADLSGFGDASSIRGYAQEALSWAHAQGLVLGFEDGSLRPQGTASRAQIAAVLMRFLAAVPTE